MTAAEPVSPVLEPATHGAEQARSVDNTSGDPVCWLDKVCPTCGLLSGSDDLTCQRCGHTDTMYD
jgi:ribosomal protein S27AE